MAASSCSVQKAPPNQDEIVVKEAPKAVRSSKRGKGKIQEANEHVSQEINCDKCSDAVLFTKSGISVPYDQVAAMGLSFICRMCKVETRVNALTELNTSLVEDKRELQQELEKTKKELARVQEVLNNVLESKSSDTSKVDDPEVLTYAKVARKKYCWPRSCRAKMCRVGHKEV